MKKEALAKWLHEDISEVGETSYDDCAFTCCGEQWLILTDKEADEKASLYIQDSLWAFNAEFILSHSKVKLSPDALRRIQEKECESANELVESLIDDMEHFIHDAIGADGRGHFLSPYDGEEQELENNLFGYRTN